ncbi:MAG: FtsX-like permease family protein [Pyrinomonadaceae bacterium]
MLARGIAREREMAIRMALGAGRLRLIRQMLTESSLLVLLAGAVGLLLARLGIQALLSLSPPNIPNLDNVEIDARVLAFTHRRFITDRPAFRTSSGFEGFAGSSRRGTERRPECERRNRRPPPAQATCHH